MGDVSCYEGEEVDASGLGEWGELGGGGGGGVLWVIGIEVVVLVPFEPSVSQRDFQKVEARKNTADEYTPIVNITSQKALRHLALLVVFKARA